MSVNLDYFGMFDYHETEDGLYEYTADEFATLIQALVGTGVSAAYGDKFAVTASGLVLTIKSGAAFALGRYAKSDQDISITLDPEVATKQRIDTIVITVDKTNLLVYMEAVKGTPATSDPTAPDLTQSDVMYQLPLQDIVITDGSTATVSTDRRTLTYPPTSILALIQSNLEALTPADIGASATDHTHTPASIGAAVSYVAQSVTLPVAGWDTTAKTQTVTIASVAGAADLLVTPAPVSYVAYGEAQVRATSNTDTTITFACTDVPTVELAVQIKPLA